MPWVFILIRRKNTIKFVETSCSLREEVMSGYMKTRIRKDDVATIGQDKKTVEAIERGYL